MTDSKGPQTPPAGDGGQPPAGDPSVAPPDPQAGDRGTPAEPTPSAKPPETVDELPSWAQNLVKDLRSENAKHRTAAQQREDAEKSAVEKAQAEVTKRDERISSLEGRLKRASVIEQFGPNGRAGWAMANDLGLEFEFNDELRATNVDKVRKELEKQEPTIFGAGQADAGSRTAGDGGYQGPPGRERIAWAHRNNRT